MSLFKNEVGRPSNETKKKRKIFYTVIVLVILLVFVVGGIFVKNNFFNTIEANDKNALIGFKSNRFVVKKLKNYCYKIEAPKTVEGWSVALELVRKGSDIVQYNYIDHFEDGVKSQEVCFSKQAYGTKEKHRIELRWKSSKSAASIRPLLWKYSYNKNEQQTYKDYSVNWLNIPNKLYLSEEGNSLREEESTIKFEVLHTFKQNAYFSVIEEREIEGNRSIDIKKNTCEAIKKNKIKTLTAPVKKYELGFRYRVELYSDSSCKTKLATEYTYHYVYKTDLNGIATPSNKLSIGGAGISIKLFQTHENYRYYIISKKPSNGNKQAITKCTQIKYGTKTQEIKMANGDNNIEYTAKVYSDSNCNYLIGNEVNFGKFSMKNGVVTKVN